MKFQSTHPVWDGTGCHRRQRRKSHNFNPPIPCGMGPNRDQKRDNPELISIHPSRVGWDDEWELDEIAWE